MRRAWAWLFALAAATSPLWSGGLIDPLSLDATDAMILVHLRIPRLACAFFAGGVLSLAGLLFQNMFQNPLATPYTLGVSTGASLAVALGIFFGAAGSVPLLAFAGAASVSAVLLLVQVLWAQTTTLLLMGVAIGLLASGALSVLHFFGDAFSMASFFRWSLGSTDVMGYGPVALCAGAFALVASFARLRRAQVTLLGASRTLALARGLDVARLQREILALVSLAVSLVVSQTGPIGFVGLVVPHFVKLGDGRTFRHHYLKCALFGGCFLTLACALSHSFAGTALPVGAVTTLIGVPCFVFILARRRPY